MSAVWGALQGPGHVSCLGLCVRSRFCEAKETAAGSCSVKAKLSSPVVDLSSFYIFVSQITLGRKISWNCQSINMSWTEFDYSGVRQWLQRKVVCTWVYSLSQFISLAVHLVMSKVPLTKQSTHYSCSLACHHASLMLPCVLQEAIFKSHLSTGSCVRMYRLLHILLLIDGAIWLEEK